MIQLHAEHAFNAVFGLPAVAARPVQTREWQFSLEHGNQFFGSVSGLDCVPSDSCQGATGDEHELLYVDGETSRLTIRGRQSIGACWQGELVLPFYQHHGGVFDRAIEDWHTFFGMPDAGRQYHPTEQLTYRYANGAGERVRVDTPQSGIGDIIVAVQREPGCRDAIDAAGSGSIVRAGLKLPTGSLSELRGTERTDAFLDMQSPIWRHGERWQTGATLGLMWSGRNRQLPSQHPVVAFGAVGAQYRLSQRIRAMAQIDWHTPFYDSELGELGEPTLVLSTGVRHLLRPEHTLELTISEDIKVESAPDIVARLAWIYRPK